jgi:hypothetical protein
LLGLALPLLRGRRRRRRRAGGRRRRRGEKVREFGKKKTKNTKRSGKGKKEKRKRGLAERKWAHKNKGEEVGGRGGK